MKKIRVGICHRSVSVGDAIGNDITGGYAVLERMGLLPEIVGQYFHQKIISTYRCNTNLDPEHIQGSYDLLIYHHSIEWVDGENIIERFSGPVVIKYHNITPERYFSNYTQLYVNTCRLGREQTGRLVCANNVRLWQCASSFNLNELNADCHQVACECFVVPPFMYIDEFFMEKHQAIYDNNHSINLLFVGRRAPNKGHKHLLRMMKSFLEIGWGNVRLRIVGADDKELSKYNEELFTLTYELGIASNIEWLTHISDHELRNLFLTSHVYVNMSEHEGFCVPIIESQAIGLPVITVDTTALRDTTGPNQIIVPFPSCDEDYDMIAGLVYEIFVNSELRQNLVWHGFKNAYERFSQENIENMFISSLEPILREL